MVTLVFHRRPSVPINCVSYTQWSCDMLSSVPQWVDTVLLIDIFRSSGWILLSLSFVYELPMRARRLSSLIDGRYSSSSRLRGETALIESGWQCGSCCVCLYRNVTAMLSAVEGKQARPAPGLVVSLNLLWSLPLIDWLFSINSFHCFALWSYISFSRTSNVLQVLTYSSKFDKSSDDRKPPWNSKQLSEHGKVWPWVHWVGTVETVNRK